jgi:hypothetical protein
MAALDILSTGLKVDGNHVQWLYQIGLEYKCQSQHNEGTSPSRQIYILSCRYVIADLLATFQSM